MIRSTVALLGLLLPAISQAAPAPAHCATHFLGGDMPEVAAARTASTRMLCFSGFALLHSGATKTPVWSAEHLTSARIKAADALTRPKQSPFHAETRLPPAERATPADYEHSGFDQGHMSPNGDMATPTAQTESFSLANMVPQDPCDNERIWKNIEEAVRKFVADGGEVYVVTGPVYDRDAPASPASIGKGVAVPSRVFKAVYEINTGKAAVYVTKNANTKTVEVLSLTQLRAATGVDAFPSLVQTVKDRAATLPPVVIPAHDCKPR